MKELLTIQDGIQWKVANIWQEANTFLEQRDALEKIGALLSLLEDEFLQGAYIESVQKLTKVSKKEIQKFLKKESEDVDINIEGIEELAAHLPKGVDVNEFMTFGFYALQDDSNPLKTGYYFNIGKGQEQVKISNFIMKPLFHLESKEDNKRMVEIYNGFESKILEMPSKSMISIDQFTGAMYEEGNFLFEGNKAQLLRIHRKLGNQFPKASELRTMGWQEEGFFAFSNCIVSDRVRKFNELGIAEFNGKNFFSPSCSIIYRDVRKDDDPYENDRYLNMKQSPIDFEEWAKLFCTVYPEHGPVGIAYVFLTCFRDLVFKLDNNCPHLYAFGEKRSGKSKFMESISNLFYSPLRSFNLNSGTDFAFSKYLERFRNCFAFMNEFDDKAIREEWFQALKAAYDGEGRERGKGGSRNRTEITRVNSAIGLAGQYLSTRDDNSLLSRSIVLAFRPIDNRTKDMNDAYNRLKLLEEQGINSIIGDLMMFRGLVEKDYTKTFHEIFAQMREWCSSRNTKWEDRINRNHCALLVMAKIFGKELKLPFSYNTFFDSIMEKVVDLTRVMSQSDLLSEFWRIVSTLADSGEIIRGYHYKIKAELSLKVNEETEAREFGSAKRILYIRFNAIHSAYKKAYRSETGKEGMNAESIVNYFKNREYFLGRKEGVRFSGLDKRGVQVSTNPTSALVFDYEIMERLGTYMDYSPNDSPDSVEPSESVNTIGEVSNTANFYETDNSLELW